MIDEVIWRDDSIRWEGGLRDDAKKKTSVSKDAERGNEESSSSDDEQEFMIDPFADPDPFELFSFDFRLPDKNTVSIQIRGYKTNADEIWQSTGLTLWRASSYLCEYQIEQYPRLFGSNKRVLELGAGLGLNGILAWKLMSSCGAEKNESGNGNDDTDDGLRKSTGEVCITDGDSDALVHLRDNVERNRSLGSNETTTTTIVSCHQLIWGKKSSENFLECISHNEKYNVLLASDIIYSPVIVEPLWETVQTLLTPLHGVFLMAFAKRKVPVSIDMVLQAAVEKGFEYDLVKEDLEEGIWVYEFRLNH
jgi:predicted nicotinamide N-methyase